MNSLVHAKVLCRHCRTVHPREYSESEAWLRHVADGEWLASPKCIKCVSAADRQDGKRWWKPERLSLQPVP